MSTKYYSYKNYNLFHVFFIIKKKCFYLSYTTANNFRCQANFIIHNLLKKNISVPIYDNR